MHLWPGSAKLRVPLQGPELQPSFRVIQDRRCYGTCCGDLQVALDIVAGPGPLEGRSDRLRSDAAAADLVRWALSDDYAKIRAEFLRTVR